MDTHQPRSATTLRLECSRIILFGLLLMSAFLSSMMHVSPDAAYDPPASAHSGPASPSVGGSAAHSAPRR